MDKIASKRFFYIFLYLSLICLSFSFGEVKSLWAEDGGNFTTAIDPDLYIVGPGDKFRIDFWDGSTEVINLTVTPEGSVLLKSMGLLSVRNLTLTEARKKLRKLIGQFYSDSDFSVSLDGVRNVKVMVSGAVIKPGLYDGYASQRVSEMIELAAGLRPGACRRDIRISDADRVRTADLLLFERTGSLRANPYIYSGNNIEVSFIRDSSVFVQISGEVFLPGGLEYSKNDNLETIINLAMGFSGLESDSIIIYRKESDGYRQFAIDKSRLDFPVKPGDKIIVPRRDNDITADYFSIAGEVIRPGRYPYSKGMHLDRAITEARGLTSEADISSLAIFRKQKDNLTPEALKILEETNPNRLSLTGESAPVAIAFDLLKREGGSFDQIDILPGDSIIFSPLTGLVSVFGMVRNPGTIMFRKSLSANDCIKLAGGYSPGAEKKSIRLIRKSTGANIVVTAGAEIYDGDRIIVVEKRNKKDLWDKIKDISLILGGLGVAYLAIDNMTD